MDAEMMEMDNVPSIEGGLDGGEMLDISEPQIFEGATELDATLSAVFSNDAPAESDSSTSMGEQEALPEPSEPGALDYTPSETGVQYPPERKEGNYGGTERLG